MTAYTALLYLSFGGPEGPDDVLPFLENVTRGRDVPRERLLEVAEHYQHFGGVSPINAQNRAIIEALGPALAEAGTPLPIYFGNRNWHPLLGDTLARMVADGHRRVLCFATSAFSSYSGCRQYREDLGRALAALGDRAPEVHKLRVFFDHPRFVDAVVGRVREALARAPEGARLVFTAHSIPLSMARTSRYEEQLRAVGAIVAERPGFDLVWQSRSGPPSVPWLEPDIVDHLRALAAAGERAVVVSPLGFLTDHMEVVWDLDHEAADVARELGLTLVRAGTPGTHPGFVATIAELVREQTAGAERRALTALGEGTCTETCCPAPTRRTPPPGGSTSGAGENPRN
jgi:ferrochelatase